MPLNTLWLSEVLIFEIKMNQISLSFIGASLRPDLARIIAEAYLKNRDWDVTQRTVLSNNALQAKSKMSGVRIERELRVRLQTLTLSQIELLASGTADTRTALAWLSLLKQTPFIFQLVSEVIRNKIEMHDPYFRPSDYENYFTTLCERYPDLANISSSTRIKARSMVHTMLREIGVLDKSPKDLSIKRPPLPHNVMDCIVVDNKKWLAGFLFSNPEIQALKAA